MLKIRCVVKKPQAKSSLARSTARLLGELFEDNDVGSVDEENVEFEETVGDQVLEKGDMDVLYL